MNKRNIISEVLINVPNYLNYLIGLNFKFEKLHNLTSSF
jgi:hypothetical protein